MFYLLINSKIGFCYDYRKPREGAKVQVQFPFFMGSSPAFTFAPEGIKRYFGIKRDKVIAMLSEHYHIIPLINSKIYFYLFNEVMS